MNRFQVVLACTLLLILAGAVHAAELSLPQLDANAGESVQIDFSLDIDPGQAVAAVQFELAFNSELVALTTLETGPAAEESGKSVSTREFAPGSFRVIVAGLNQNEIASGILLRGQFQIPAATPSSTVLLVIDNLVMSSPTGRPVTATAGSGTLRITGTGQPPPPDPGEGCGCHAADGGPPPASDLITLAIALGVLLRRRRGRGSA